MWLQASRSVWPTCGLVVKKMVAPGPDSPPREGTLRNLSYWRPALRCCSASNSLRTLRGDLL